MSHHRLSLVLTSVAATAALVVGAVAVNSSADEPGSGNGPKVVASFYPMEYLAERIGGTRVEVTGLTAPGVEPHDLELGPRQVAAVGDADLVLYLKGLQPAVDSAVTGAANRSTPARTVDATDYAALQQRGGETDPHLWLDPKRYAEVARGVGAALAEADPAHAADYRADTDAVVADLTSLDTEFRTGLASCRSHDFLTSHAAFGYLASAYGLEQLSVSGLDPETEPSAARLAEVKQQAREHGVTTVFTETLAGPKLAQALAGELGLRTATLDTLEGAPADGDYLTAMRANLTALQGALGCTR